MRTRPTRVRTPDRAYYLLSGPVAAALVLPAKVEWRCARLWWPAARSWSVATEIDGYPTYVGGSGAAIDAVLIDPALDHLLAYNNDLDTPDALAVALTRPESALVFAGYAALALAVGTVLLYRRDPD